MRLIACAIAVGSLGCASAPVADTPSPDAGASPSENAARVQTKDYAFPVPASFSELRTGAAEQVWQQGGAAIVAEKRPEVADGFLASIVVTPIPVAPGTQLTRAECEESARGMAAAIPAELVEWTMTDVCRWTLTENGKPTRGARAIVKTGASTWMITCNYDTRDAAAIAACGVVDAGWTRP